MRISDFAGVGDLGAAEYWVIDEESKEKLIGAHCAPFMIAPGFTLMTVGQTERAGTSYFSGFSPRIFSGSLCRLRIPTKAELFGLGNLGYFEVVAPSGLPVAGFRCQPFDVPADFAVKDVRGGRETLIQRGAAEFPEGTIRPRISALRTFKR